MKPELSIVIKQILALYKKYRITLNFIGMMVLFTIVIQGLIHNLVMDTLLFSYLSYQTLLTIKLNHNNNEKLIYMLKLWGCYSTYLIAEKAVDIIMFFSPYSYVYYTGKISFYVWILQSDNICIYYDTVINPLFIKHEPNITLFVICIKKYINVVALLMYEYTSNMKIIIEKLITEKINDETITQFENNLLELHKNAENILSDDELYNLSITNNINKSDNKLE